MEDLVGKGYTISGRGSDVDSFCADKNVIGHDILGGLKSAHILGDQPAHIPAALEVTRLDLQRLFIKLTSEGNCDA